MTRADKIKLLQQVATGQGTIDEMEPVPPIICIIYDEDSSLFDCSGFPKSWGYPERLTREQVDALQQRIDQYSQRRARLG